MRGPGPVLATAVHDGHELRHDVAEAMILPDTDRLREEDPFTGETVTGVSTHVIVHRSRFEFDINRGHESAVYRTPDQSWGLNVWKEPPPQTLVEESLRIHSAYYHMLGALLDDMAAQHDRFVLIDVHSYNHRRSGVFGEPTKQKEAPDVNIGTFSMPREAWAFLLDPWMDALRGFNFNGRQLDVRENVAFQGKGEQTRFVHERYPRKGCAIALEFKKFFMDEWTGVPDPTEVAAMRDLIAFSAKVAEDLLKR